jgi:hypothetical protein
MLDAGCWLLAMGCGYGIQNDERRAVEGQRLMVADNLKISELSYLFSDICHLVARHLKP